MNRLRFKAGDLARMVSVENPTALHLVGRIVEIFVVGPFVPMVPFRLGERWYTTLFGFDYIVLVDAYTAATVLDSQLAPLDGPPEPASLTRPSDLEEPVTA